MTRLERVGELITELGHDALLVSAPSNIRYLTGFTGSTGYLLVQRDGSAVAVTDSRYAERIAEETHGVDLTIRIAPVAGRKVLAELLGDGALGVEADVLSWAEVQGLQRLLSNDRVHATTGAVSYTHLTLPTKA